MRILLLVSSFNGLSQRVWCRLREGGHEVVVEFASDPEAVFTAARSFGPDLIVCPFLKERVPERVWRTWRTIIIHPGPVGDRGPSSLDHAIADGAPRWGVTALQAVDELDAGPIWATATFPMPAEPPRKTELYTGPVADAAVECVREVVAKAADPAFAPVPLEVAKRPIPGTGLRPRLRQEQRAFSWEDPPEAIVRKIRAADGSPGVRTTVAGVEAFAYDAHPGTPVGAALGSVGSVGSVGSGGPAGPVGPGGVLGQAEGAVLVRAGGSGAPDDAAGHGVWLGHLRLPGGIKLPATVVLRSVLHGVPHLRPSPLPWLTYRRDGAVGTVAFRPYNGALSTRQCRSLVSMLRFALRQDTSVVVLRGAFDVFSTGIHLGMIEASPNPASEAWDNIRAINAVCRQICAASRQTLIAAFTGNAGAGGVMLALGADLVAARAGVVLNPYYDMGIYGSELHTLTLPRRVGSACAARLLGERLPLDAGQALSIGLVDVVGPRDPAEFDGWLGDLAERTAVYARHGHLRAGHGAGPLSSGERPLSYYETAELAEMAQDIFDDRNGFAARRSAFVHKQPAPQTPPKLSVPRPKWAVP